MRHWKKELKISVVIVVLSSCLLSGCGSLFGVAGAIGNAAMGPSGGSASGSQSGSASSGGSASGSQSGSSSSGGSASGGQSDSSSQAGSSSDSSDSEKPEVIPTITIDFEALLAPADDEYDFRYASDYVNHKFSHVTYLRDEKSVGMVLDFPKVDRNEIEKVLKKNKNISAKYRQFILDYIDDWDRLYPGSSHTVFYQNLKTLKIHEVGQSEINRKTLSTDARACYMRSENAIYVLNTIDISRGSNGYIELTHELTHAARQFDFTDKKTKERYCASYYEKLDLGSYTEEALITDFAYEMQGLGEKSIYYTLLSSYFRIILEAIDYDGADFMNHSVNYLIDVMNEYTGTDEAALVLAQMESQAILRYTPYIGVAYTDFSELYAYIVKIYMSKHLTENMSYEQAEKVFDDFYEEILFHFTDIYSAYGITEESFRPGFQEALEKFGIRQES